MATPSLALIPSGYKAQKVYSVLPTNGDGDFTFARSGTATRVNQSGLIETVGNDVPRLDYSDGGCPSLLLEPERTNLITYSEDFSQSDWSIFDVSKSANSVVSPDGTLNGARITALSGTNRVFQQLVTVSADPINNRVFTGSIYIKSSSVTSCFLRVGSATSNNAITISNEWQRFEAQYTLGATFTAVRLGIVLNNEGDEVDVAFGQVEQGSYATSYIPTVGSAVTRIADSCDNGGNEQVFNDSEGVLYTEISALSNDGTNRRIAISDNSTNNRVVLGFTTGNTILALVASSGTQFISTIAISDIKLNNKFALKYKENDFALWVNGIEVATDTSGNAPIGLSTLKLKGSTGVSDFYGNVKDVRVYNTTLTDAELQALTQ